MGLSYMFPVKQVQGSISSHMQLEIEGRRHVCCFKQNIYKSSILTPCCFRDHCICCLLATPPVSGAQYDVQLLTASLYYK